MQIAQSLSDKKIKFDHGPYNSGVTMPAARVLNDSDIVVLTVASNPKITEMGYNNLFPHRRQRQPAGHQDGDLRRPGPEDQDRGRDR